MASFWALARHGRHQLQGFDEADEGETGGTSGFWPLGLWGFSVWVEGLGFGLRGLAVGSPPPFQQ